MFKSMKKNYAKEDKSYDAEQMSFDLTDSQYLEGTQGSIDHQYAAKFAWENNDDIDYAFNEKELLEEMLEYINATYDAHYSQDKYQSTEIIEDMGHGMGFALGNVIKYCQRYGKKEGFNRDDLKKVIHYGIIALAMHDRKKD